MNIIKFQQFKFIGILTLLFFLITGIRCEDTQSDATQNTNTEENPIKVSIIIPAYNAEEFINRSVESALNQTLKEIEVIVVNDKSTDGTLEALKKYDNDKRVTVVNLEKNQGPSGSRNAGLKIAKGEFIGFIDSDDMVTPDFYESLYKISKDKDVVIGIFVNSTNGTNGFTNHPNYVNYGCVGDSIWRKSFLDKNHIDFYTKRRMGEDRDFRKKVLKLKPRVIKSKDVGAYYIYKRRKGSLMHYSDKKLNSLTNEAEAKLQKLNEAEAKLQKSNKAEAKLQKSNKAEAELQKSNKAEAELQKSNKAETELQKSNKAEAKLQKSNKSVNEDNGGNSTSQGQDTNTNVKSISTPLLIGSSSTVLVSGIAGFIFLKRRKRYTSLNYDKTIDLETAKLTAAIDIHDETFSDFDDDDDEDDDRDHGEDGGKETQDLLAETSATIINDDEEANASNQLLLSL